MADIVKTVKIEAVGLREINSELDKLKAGITEVTNPSEMSKLSAEADNLTNKLSGANTQLQNIQGIDYGKMASSIGQIAGGLGAVATAGALLAAGSEDAEKFFKTFATGLAITNAIKGATETFIGIQQLQTIATNSQAAAQLKLNLAALANPYVLLAAGIAAVGIALLTYERETTAAEKAQLKLNEAQGQAIRETADETTKLAVLYTVITDVTSSEESRTKALKELNEVLPDSIGYITQENIATKEGVGILRDYIKNLRSKIELKALEEQLSIIVGNRLGMEMELINLQKTAPSSIVDEAKERIKATKEEEEALLKLVVARQVAAFEGSSTETSGSKEAKGPEEKKTTNTTTTSTSDPERDKLVELNDFKKAQALELLLFENELRRQGITDQADLDLFMADAKIKSARDIGQKIIELDFEDKAILAEQENTNLKLIEDARIEHLDNRILTEKETLDELQTLKDEAIKKDIDAYRAAENAKLNMASNSLGVLTSLIDTFGKKDEDSKKKQFNINKGIAIAQAGIQTFQAAQGAYLSQLSIPTPDAPIRAAAAAGIATAVGLANIAKIAATQYNGGVGGGPTPPSNLPSVGGSSSIGNGQTGPNINFTNNGDGSRNNVGAGGTTVIKNEVVISEVALTDVQTRNAAYSEMSKL